jgi:ABC-type transport system involved in cytochrome bd biosynthesis fused ATPase/permease subunit
VSNVGRRGPVDIRLIRLVPALRQHLVVVAGLAAVTAVAVVVQAEVLATGLTDLVQDGNVTGGLVRLALLLAGVGVTRAAAAGTAEWSAARAMRATRQTIVAAVLDHAVADGDRTSTGQAHREAMVSPH